MANLFKPPSWINNLKDFNNVLKGEISEASVLATLVNFSDLEPIKKALRQLHFWTDQLTTQTNDKTCIFAFLGPKGLIRPNVMEVCKALENKIDMSKMSEVFVAANTNFMGISFNNVTDAEKVRETFSFYNDSFVCHIEVKSPFDIPFRISWLPPLFDLSLIESLLQRYSSKHSYKRDTRQTGDHRFTPTNSIRGMMHLHPDMTIEKIPHLVTLPKPYVGSVLITIPTRPSICLKCRESGHIRKECKAVKCVKCHNMHSISSPCPLKNYAQAARGGDLIVNTNIGDWSDDVEEPDFSHTNRHNTQATAFFCDKSLVAKPLPLKLNSLHQIGNSVKTVAGSSDDTIQAIEVLKFSSTSKVSDCLILDKDMLHNDMLDRDISDRDSLASYISLANPTDSSDEQDEGGFDIPKTSDHLLKDSTPHDDFDCAQKIDDPQPLDALENMGEKESIFSDDDYISSDTNPVNENTLERKSRTKLERIPVLEDSGDSAQPDRKKQKHSIDPVPKTYSKISYTHNNSKILQKEMIDPSSLEVKAPHSSFG